MAWEDVFNLITGVLLSVGSAGAIITFVGKCFAKNIADKALEKERVKYARVLAEYQNELSAISYEHQVRFAQLHKERAEVLANTYVHVRETFNRLSDLALETPEPSEKNVKRVQESLDKLNSYFPYKRIYIKYETANKIDNFRVNLERTFQEFVYHPYQYDYSIKFQRVHTDLSTLLSELELEFRTLLGENISQEDGT
ncbi:hypothetical protein [Vibrio atlanticus]|uniref:hypothetical protein n=1 Tax=Vibrio atlanticus TaxID=693153 RepID=UPI00354EB69B